MKLRFDDGYFIFECTYEERNIPKEARFWWNPFEMRWQTTSMRCAARLMRYADQEARSRLVDRFTRGFMFSDHNQDKPRRGGRINIVRRK